MKQRMSEAPSWELTGVGCLTFVEGGGGGR